MKIKIPLLVLAAICVVTLCVRFAQSTVAQDLPSDAKSKQSVKAVCADLKNAEAAFRVEHYEQAIEAAKRVLSISTCSDDRIKAHTLLISSVRSSQGYDAAIKRAEGVYAYVLKTRPHGTYELVHLKTLLADIKQRRASYQQTIAQQEKVIKARPKSDEAAQAALKIAAYKQKLGTPKDAVTAYEEVVRDYPLTRSGWKAAQEVALLRQSNTGTTSTSVKMETASVFNVTIEDGRKSLRDGRPSEAEKTARQLIASKESKDRGEAVELLIRAVAAGAGSKEAAKQAWQLACGSPEFKPSYSDVLRLEATVLDLTDETAANAKVAEKEDKPVSEQQASDSGTIYSTQSAPKGEADSSRRNRPSQTASASRSSAFGGFPPAVAWPGASPGSGVVTPSPKKQTPRRTTPGTPAPSQSTPTPSNPNPVVTPTPVHSNPDIPSITPDPKPLLERWLCDTQYREADGDKQAISDLMDEHLAEAGDILFYHKIIDPSPDATLENERLRAVGIATSAAIWASQTLEDYDIALSICSLYLLPHLKDTRKERWDYRSRDSVLIAVTGVLQKAEEIEHLIDLYKWWISWDECRNNADANCARLAGLLVGLERYEEAIAYLKMIDENGECAASRGFIPELELKLQQQQQSKSGQGTNSTRGQ